ncbi:hypothetical protein [Aliikangiella sp. IMCC44359]|uniref:hypothetical protein n=1 Tax=Aliikangiella sp. IMCC44359 TaxID=3459125 RepID=UPI00403AA11A
MKRIIYIFLTVLIVLSAELSADTNLNFKCAYLEAEKSKFNTLKVEQFEFSKIKICGEIGSLIKKYYILENIQETPLNNCMYRFAEVSDAKKIVDDGYFKISRKLKNKKCPVHASESYLTLNKNKLGANVDGLFVSISKLLDKLKGSEEDVENIFSSMSFFKRFFCSTCSDFVEQLSSVKNKDSIKIMNFVQDFIKGAQGNQYLLHVKNGVRAWSLIVVIENSKVTVSEIDKIEL